jgi:hypothetical protein
VDDTKNEQAESMFKQFALAFIPGTRVRIDGRWMAMRSVVTSVLLPDAPPILTFGEAPPPDRDLMPKHTIEMF